MRDVSQHSSLPFPCTPDPARLCMSASHEAALQAIHRCVEERRGFVAILGPPGVGKTTILNAYLQRAAPPQCVTFALLYPQVSFAEMLQAMGQKWGLQAPVQDGPPLVEAMRQHLVRMCDQGHVFLLILDEAQHIPVQTLLALLRFSDAMQTASGRLVQMVFLGQPAFAQQLQLPELQPLRQALELQVTIEPFTDAQSRAYIQRSLKEVAVPAEAGITDESVRHIIKRAKGIPRVINTLCTEALLSLPARQPHPPVEEARHSPPSVPRPWEVPDVAKLERRSAARRWALACAVAAVCLVGFFWYVPYERVLDQVDQIRQEVWHRALSNPFTKTVSEGLDTKSDTQDLAPLWATEIGMESAVLTPLSVSQAGVETAPDNEASLPPESSRVSADELLTALASPEAAPSPVEPPRNQTAAAPPDILSQVVALMQQWQPAGSDFALHVEPHPAQSVYTEGDTLSARVEAATRAYLYVDYYQANGDVVHLLPNALDHNVVDVDRAYVIGGSEMTYQFAFSPPFGEELLTVIASEHPLDAPQLVTRMIEPSSEYLPRLAAYFKTHKPTGKVAITHLVIRTSS
jgi:type II secretory pathway predicted ATPase ExeA